MPKDLMVVMCCPYITGTLKLYLWQLEKAGIEYRLLPTPPPGLGGRIESTLWVAKEFSDYRAIICSDAFDVTFYGTKAEVMGKIPDHGVLQAAEKNCYPEDLAAREKIQGSTPWKYVNGGLSMGTPQSFMAWCDEVKRHPDYRPDVIDQEFFNRRLVESSPLCVLDSRTDVFFCLYTGYEELKFERGRPVNTLCGTHPNFIHANGRQEIGSLLVMEQESHNAGER